MSARAPGWQQMGLFIFIACAVSFLVDSAAGWARWALLLASFCWALLAVLFPPWRVDRDRL
jgi:hypothetical protein